MRPLTLRVSHLPPSDFEVSPLLKLRLVSPTQTFFSGYGDPKSCYLASPSLLDLPEYVFTSESLFRHFFPFPLSCTPPSAASPKQKRSLLPPGSGPLPHSTETPSFPLLTFSFCCRDALCLTFPPEPPRGFSPPHHLEPRPWRPVFFFT